MATPKDVTAEAIAKFERVCEAQRRVKEELRSLAECFLDPQFDIVVYLDHTEELRAEYIRNKLNL